MVLHGWSEVGQTQILGLAEGMPRQIAILKGG